MTRTGADDVFVLSVEMVILGQHQANLDPKTHVVFAGVGRAAEAALAKAILRGFLHGSVCRS